MPVCAVSGTAGVGKTALAVHWAQRVAGRFPDGQLYVNLRGFDPAGPALDPGQVLRGFLDAFGVPAARVPADLDAQAGLYRSVLAGKRVLVVLDNARNAEQVRPLLPGSPGCLAVVTSRDQLAGLVATVGARPLALDLLTAADARELIVRRLGADRAAREPAAVEAIVAACARLPLALTSKRRCAGSWTTTCTPRTVPVTPAQPGGRGGPLCASPMRSSTPIVRRSTPNSAPPPRWQPRRPVSPPHSPPGSQLVRRSK
jgi:hypothetical protein